MTQIQQNTVIEFISRNSFLMQMYFRGALHLEEQIRFLDTQLQSINKLDQNITFICENLNKKS